MMTFEPKIITFLCTWCSYTGADTAGIARLKSPSNIRAIRVPCSGRVAPEIIMKTFDQGADGVLVLGCHIGECHYDSGNHRTAKRLPILQSLMAFAGLEPERLHLDWVSASEGERFSRIVSEFTESVRLLGPASWKSENRQPRFDQTQLAIDRSYTFDQSSYSEEVERSISFTNNLQAKARELLSCGKVACVIGYEKGTHNRTRPVFIYTEDAVERLVWNKDCTHNLTVYLRRAIYPPLGKQNGEPGKSVAIVAKPCDSRAINVHLAGNHFQRDQVHVIGMACEGILDKQQQYRMDHILQERCLHCTERLPVIYDTLIGEPPANQVEPTTSARLYYLETLSPIERMDFWLSHFDRCIRCYACRQVCPMCDCPTCLFEQDDSLWVGPGIRLDEKRIYHLGRAYHLAGKCVDCHECERVCPVNIPISLINSKLNLEMEKFFGYRAGEQAIPSPLLTILSGEERLP